MATGETEYRMTSSPSGRAVIIYNGSGPEKDRDDLKKLFEELNFKTEIHNNKTSQEITQILNWESIHSDHEASDAFILCLLCHGSKGCVYGVDGKGVKLDEILTVFNPKHSSELAGKPKIAIIQAHQGGMSSESQPSLNIDILDREHIEADAEADKTEYVYIDMLTAYTTVTDDKSYRNSTDGSWFINAIVEIFHQYKKHEHIVDMLARVTKTVSEKTAQKQIPEIRNHLTKKMYFYPRYAKQ